MIQIERYVNAPKRAETHGLVFESLTNESNQLLYISDEAPEAESETKSR